MFGARLPKLLCLTDGCEVRYAQKPDKIGSLGNGRPVLSLPGLVGTDTETFPVPE